jgi:hypothetical protein
MLRGAALLDAIASVPPGAREAWVDALLGTEHLPPDVALPRGSVPYLPCGVDDIVAFVRELPLREEDVLVDLGSGLGRVAMLAHLLTGARAHGVEIQGHLVELANRRTAALGLDRVTFEHADVREAELDGTVFFLYAPFNGEMLAHVLQRLEALGQRRRFAVVTVGMELRVPWLVPRPSSHVALTIHDLRQSR